MKTDLLLDLLAREVAPVSSGAVARRLGIALACGLPVAGMFMLYAFGLRTDIAQAAPVPMFWGKLLFPGLVAAAACGASERLARPGTQLGGIVIALVAPVLMLWLVSAWILLAAAPGERGSIVLGTSWSMCPLGIALISLPMFGAAFWAMRGLAPTRPALAGAAAGLAAGAFGAMLYALHCTEMQAPFLAVWYVAGMAIPAVLGALLGPRLLRW